MEDLKESLTYIVQEKGIASLIVEYTYFCPCKYCKKLNLEKDTIFCSDFEYECLTVSDECKEIQVKLLNEELKNRLDAQNESDTLRENFVLAAHLAGVVDIDWPLAN